MDAVNQKNNSDDALLMLFHIVMIILYGNVYFIYIHSSAIKEFDSCDGHKARTLLFIKFSTKCLIC